MIQAPQASDPGYLSPQPDPSQDPGAAGPGPGGGAQIPPELLALLAGGGPPGQGAPSGAPAPDQGAPDLTQMTPLELLRHGLEFVQAAMAKEPDDADSAKLAAAVKVLYEVFTNRQKEQDAALGTSPAQKLIGRGGFQA